MGLVLLHASGVPLFHRCEGQWNDCPELLFLPKLLECGEDRFLIEWDSDTDKVRYDILAFSRPNHILTRLGYPLVRRSQKRFGRDSAATLCRAVNSVLPITEVSQNTGYTRSGCSDHHQKIQQCCLFFGAQISSGITERVIRTSIRQIPCVRFHFWTD
ncbi:MAG: DUF1990 family protein [Zavarzinella sp.]